MTDRPDRERDPVADLNHIAFLLERAHEPTYRVRAFRGAAATVAALSREELERRIRESTLSELRGIGKVTAAVVAESYAGEEPAYLRTLHGTGGDAPLASGGEALLTALRGDLHTHSDWSDGGSPIEEMAQTARDVLGHEYVALTDHSPRLTVARGLSADRLRSQLRVVADLNERLAPLRILTGIEVDILEDGSLDQDAALLAQLDVVVASVHSKLRMESDDMTRRMVAAIANPHVDILGHCTGRIVLGQEATSPRARNERGGERGRQGGRQGDRQGGRQGDRQRGRQGGRQGGRPESAFDAEIVFEACRRFGVAVEINCRPERLDPPRRLLRLAVETGCRFSVDTDAHAPGQLDWQPYGCVRAEECGVALEHVVNTWPVDDLLAWTRRYV